MARCLHYIISLQPAHCGKSNTALSLWFEMNFRTELGSCANIFRDRVGTGANRAKTDVLVREIMGLSACFQSVMEASYEPLTTVTYSCVCTLDIALFSLFSMLEKGERKILGLSGI